MLHKLECLLFLKRSETGGDLSLIPSSKIEDAICLFTVVIHAVCYFIAVLLLSLWRVNLYFLSFVTLANAICTFFAFFPQLTSTICLFIALTQGMLLYVAAILSLWHILLSFAGLASSYVALFSR